LECAAPFVFCYTAIGIALQYAVHTTRMQYCDLEA